MGAHFSEWVESLTCSHQKLSSNPNCWTLAREVRKKKGKIMREISILKDRQQKNYMTRARFKKFFANWQKHPCWFSTSFPYVDAW